jgi:hypothetical protein
MNPLKQLSLGLVLVWRSLRVVAVNPRLLAYPVASWLAFVASVTGLAAIFTGRSFLPRLVDGTGLAYWLGIADVAVALLGGAILTTFFNVGLVYLSIRVLRDESPRFRDGVVAGLAMWDRVAFWGIVSSTVGPVVTLLERLDPSGLAVETLLGNPWSPASFLVLPVVAFEDARISRLFERSRQLYRKTWGYTEGASLGVDLVLLLVAVPLVVVGWYSRTAALATPTENLLGAVAVVGLLALVLVRQIAVGVSKAAVYIHATTERTPTAFTGVDFTTVSWGRRAAED